MGRLAVIVDVHLGDCSAFSEQLDIGLSHGLT